MSLCNVFLVARYVVDKFGPTGHDETVAVCADLEVAENWVKAQAGDGYWYKVTPWSVIGAKGTS